MTFQLTNDLAEMPLLAEHLEQFCSGHGIGPDVTSQFNLALDEIVTQIIANGYGNREIDRRIRINLAHDGATLIARIEDDAAAFDPLARDAASRGMNLVQTLVDEISYTRERDQNVLVIRKAI